MLGTCCACLLIVLLLVIGGIIGLAVMVSNMDDEDLNQIFLQEDPFFRKNETNAWPNTKNGLEITILNALDDEWQAYYEKAINQWDSGTPDSLTIRTENRQPDIDCVPESGYIKLCNGDYGSTHWKGMSKVLLDNNTGFIYASTAQMNDYYLSTKDFTNYRQYTICHELGHMFGLPHTDESFLNTDRGNCMDYTPNPSNNEQPGEEDFLLLAKIYGSINGDITASSKSGTTTTTTPSSTTTAESALIVPETNSKTSENETDYTTATRNGGLRRRIQQSNSLEDSIETQSPTIPQWVLEASNEVDSLLMRKSSSDSHIRRLLKKRLVHENEYAELHEFDIGNGHYIQVTLLRQL